MVPVDANLPRLSGLRGRAQARSASGVSRGFRVIPGDRAVYSELREIRRSNARNSPRYAGGFRLSNRSRSAARSQ